MFTRRASSCGFLALAVAGLMLGEALAHEQPLSAKKLLLKGNSKGKTKLVFLSKDPGIEGQTSPPASGYLELCSPAGQLTDFDLPAAEWRIKKSGAKFPGGFPTVLIKPDKTLKVACHFASDEPLGSVGVRLTFGEHVQCALFTGASVVRDQPRNFLGKNSVAPPDCSNATLGCAGGGSSSGAFVD